MFGSSSHNGVSHTALRSLARFAIITIAVLWLAEDFDLSIVGSLVPAIRAEFSVMNDEFAILSLDLSEDGQSATVRLRANLAHPLQFGGMVFYPLAWRHQPFGWYQVDSNARGVLRAALILLIVVLSWPRRSPRELILRLLLALPLMLLLIALDAPLQLLGNLEHMVVGQHAVVAFEPLYSWDRFLEGGGNTVLALVFSAFAIGIGRSVAYK